MKQIKSPFERIAKINIELASLEEKEKYYKGTEITSKQYRKIKDYEDVKSSIFFLVMEREIMQETIDFFKKEFKLVLKKWVQDVNDTEIIEELKQSITGETKNET